MSKFTTEAGKFIRNAGQAGLITFYLGTASQGIISQREIEKSNTRTSTELSNQTQRQRAKRVHSAPRIQTTVNSGVQFTKLADSGLYSTQIGRGGKMARQEPMDKASIKFSHKRNSDIHPDGNQIGKEKRISAKRTSTQIRNIERTIVVLQRIDQSSSQFISKTLQAIKDNQIPESAIPSVSKQTQEVLNASLLNLLKSTQPQDLDKLTSLDLTSIKDPRIVALMSDVNITKDLVASFDLTVDQVMNLLESNQNAINQRFNQDVSAFANGLKNEFGADVLGGLSLVTFTTLLTLALKDVKSKLPKLNKRQLVFATLLLATACGSVTNPPPAVATENPPLQQETVTSPTKPPAVEHVTSVAPVDQNLQSPLFPNLYLGRTNGNPWGEISVSAVNNQHPDFTLPDKQNASKHVTYYTLDQGGQEILRGFGLDQQYLIDLFNASPDGDKAGNFIGNLPDGTPVKFENGFWQYQKEGRNYYLLSEVANLEGETIGYPVLVVDKATQTNLYFTLVADENAALLDNTGFTPAFVSAAEIATKLGYSGDAKSVEALSFDSFGNILVEDAQGNTLQRLLYLDPYAPEATQLPPPTNTPEPTPTETSPLAQFERDYNHLIPVCVEYDQIISSSDVIPPGTTMAQLNVLATGNVEGQDIKTITVPWGDSNEGREVKVQRVVCKDANNNNNYMWLVLGGEDFGANKDGTAVYWYTAADGSNGRRIMTVQELTTKLSQGTKITVQVPVQITSSSVRDRFGDYYGVDGYSNELTNQAVRTFSQNEGIIKQIVAGGPVGQQDWLLYPLMIDVDKDLWQ